MVTWFLSRTPCAADAVRLRSSRAFHCVKYCCLYFLPHPHYSRWTSWYSSVLGGKHHYGVVKVLAKGRATSETQQGEIDRWVHTSLYHPARLSLCPVQFGVTTTYIVSPKNGSPNNRRSSVLYWHATLDTALFVYHLTSKWPCPILGTLHRAIPTIGAPVYCRNEG